MFAVAISPALSSCTGQPHVQPTPNTPLGSAVRRSKSITAELARKMSSWVRIGHRDGSPS